jgi:hypothetical protein
MSRCGPDYLLPFVGGSSGPISLSSLNDGHGSINIFGCRARDRRQDFTRGRRVDILRGGIACRDLYPINKKPARHYLLGYYS